MSLVLDVPGAGSSVPLARHWVQAILPEHPLAGAVELVVSELVTNAIRHSASGQDEGIVRVSLGVTPEAVRIEVRDQGPPGGDGAARWTPGAAADYGRGLRLVEGLSKSWGASEGEGGRLTWADIAESL